MKYPLSYISYSQLSSFIQCPYSWYETYVLRHRSGNKYTDLGKVIHEVLEMQGKQLIAEVPYVDKKYIRKYNQLFLDPNQVHRKYFTDRDEYIQFYKKGITAIENYLEVYRDSKPLFVEKKFNVQLVDGTPNCLGFIDRIDGEKDDPAEWTVTDYKSGSSPKSKDFLRKDFQLAIYAQAIYKEYGTYPRVLAYYHPVINKFQRAVHLGDGFYEYQGQRAPSVTFVVAEKMQQVKETVEAISEAYKTGIFPKWTDNWSCKNCFHLERCNPFANASGWDLI